MQYSLMVLKRGEVGSDGRIFWAYAKCCKNGERWLSPEKFKINNDRRRDLQKQRSQLPTVKAKRREYGKKAYSKNKQKAKEYWKKYSMVDGVKERNRNYLKRYRMDNKNRIRIAENKRLKIASDPAYALRERVRTRTKDAFRRNGFKKSSDTAKIVCCSWDHLRSHIESQFTKGMSWDNRNLWHVDHIVPLASAKTESEIIALCHYSNLRPLWAFDNISKGDKIIDCQPELLLAIH